MSEPLVDSVPPPAEAAVPPPTDMAVGRPLYKTAFIPIPLLLLAAAIWIHIHFDTTLGWIAAVVAGIGSAGTLAEPVWKLMDKGRIARFFDRLRNVLESPRVAAVAWSAFGIFMVLSLVLTSVHLEADEKAANVDITRYEQTDSLAPAKAMGTRRLHAGDHLISLMFVPPTGRLVWLTSTEGSQTDARRALPWVRTSFRFPAHFEALTMINLLPVGGNVLGALSTDAGLRLVVTDNVDGRDTVVSVRVGSLKALALSSASATTQDSAATVQRWEALAARQFGFAVDAAKQFVEPLWPPISVQARRRLRRGETLRLALLDPTGAAIRSDTVTLKDATTDEILLKRP